MVVETREISCRGRWTKASVRGASRVAFCGRITDTDEAEDFHKQSGFGETFIAERKAPPYAMSAEVKQPYEMNRKNLHVGKLLCPL